MIYKGTYPDLEFLINGLAPVDWGEILRTKKEEKQMKTIIIEKMTRPGGDPPRPKVRAITYYELLKRAEEELEEINVMINLDPSQTIYRLIPGCNETGCLAPETCGDFELCDNCQEDYEYSHSIWRDQIHDR